MTYITIKKLFSWITTLSIVLQTIAPLATITPVAYAQESTPTVAVSTTQTVEPTPTLVETATPTETVAPTDAPTDTVAPATSPTDTIAPTETVVVTPTVAPTETLAPTATIIPTVTTTPTPTVVESAATVTTNKLDYYAWETVTITGKGFHPMTNYGLVVSSNDPPAVTQSQVVFTDDTGSFTAVYQLDGNYRPNYSVEVKNGASVVATTTFTDAFSPSIDIYSQCSNDDGDGYATGDVGCRWTNGNLNSSNSTYHEGDSTVQRLAIKDLKAGDHTVTIQYDSLKGGKHAYDFITDDNFSELAPNPLTDADLCDPSFSNFASCSITNPGGILSNIIPADSNAAGHDTAAGSNRHFKIRNGDWVNGGISSGPTVVSGTDQPTNIQLKFNVNPSNCANSYTVQGTPVCEVLITFGAHVSSQSDWGVGNSAISISGSPYHVRTVELDGASIGNRDNQMAASAIILPSTITVHKVTSPSSDTTTSFAYTTTGTGYSSFNLTGGTSNTQTVSPGSYTVVESDPGSMYANTDLTCTATGTGTSVTPTLATRSVSITIGSTGGGVVDCIYTNTLQQAHLTLVKTVTNDNGGSALPSAWTLTATGPTSISGTTGSGTVTNAAVNQGSYTLSESGGPANYTSSTFSCVKNGGAAVVSNSITLAAGDNVTCTINNNDNPPALHLRKTVTNDNGGTAVVTDWTLSATGTGGTPTNLSGTTPVDSGATFKADTYALAESGGPSTYVAGAWNCGAATMTDATHVVVPFGGNVTCTINNNDIAPTLKLVKVVTNNNGGDKTSADWTLTASGTGGFSDAGNSTTFHSVTAGVGYVLSESTVPGYDNGTWSCDVGNLVGSTVTLSLGQNATCTITNDDQAAHLIIIKHVINDNGGTKVAGDFSGTVSGVTVAGGNTWIGSETPGVNKTLTSVGSYSVTETVDSDYDTTYSADCTGTIALGQTKTCTVTNNDKPAHLVVIKHVINDNGGTKVAGDFTTTITGVSTANPSASGVESPGVDNVLTSVGAYSVDEGAHAGYAKTLSAECSGTIAIGQTKTCTITNDDIQPKLTLTKIVVNDNGGNAVVSDFPLFVNTTGVTSGVQHGFDAGTYTASETNLPGYTASGWGGDCAANGTVTLGVGDDKYCSIVNDDEPAHIVLSKVVHNNHGGTAGVNDFGISIDNSAVLSGTTHDVNSNTAHTLNETGLTGYEFVSLTGDAKCPSVLGGNVTLDEGETVHCTVTNRDIAPQLTVIKHVVNDNGGSAVAGDWTMDVTATNPSDESFSGSENPGTTITLDVGSYAVTESGGVTGYSQTSAIGCSGTIALGESKTCTITNDDVQPKLTLIKHVVNDNGGTKVVSDFPLFVDLTSVLSGETNGFNAGSYTAKETAYAGYLPSSWSGDCAANGTVTLSVGDNKTCEITNDDIAPALHLRKTVTNDNGGTAQETDWTLVATGALANATNLSGTTPVDSGATFKADTYVLGEQNGPTGYIAGDWTCVGDVTNTGNSISLGLGQSSTCTINNDDIAPKLHLRKVVINDNGGTATGSDFTLTANGTDTNDLSGTTPVDSDTTLKADTFALSETNIAGYSASAWDCVGGTQNGSNITLGINQEATCTITNDDIAPSLTLNKITAYTHGGTAPESSWTLTADGGASGTLSGLGASGSTDVVSGATFQAGTYNLSESAAPAGYVNGASYSCVKNNGAPVSTNSISLGVGDTADCSITNTDLPAHLVVIKHVINDDGDIAQASDFMMHLTGNNLSNNDFAGSEAGVTVDLNAGSYTADETNSAGYVKTLSADCSGTIAVGQTKTCTITNNDVPHATRTQGFWQTHTVYTLATLGNTSWTIGSKVINSTNIFSAFYASLTKTSTGAKRTQLDQARMQMLQQWVAAKLNCKAFGCSVATQTMLANAATAWAGTNRTLILSYASQLDAYNNSNDALPISGQGKATPSNSQSAAQSGIASWDILP